MSTGLVCWVHDDAFAQGLSSLRSILQRIAGCAPAPAAGQCPAPNSGYPAHSAVDPEGVRSGNWARRGAIEIREQRSRARSGGAAVILGARLSDHRPLRGFRRTAFFVIKRDRGAAYMPACWHAAIWRSWFTQRRSKHESPGRCRQVDC